MVFGVSIELVIVAVVLGITIGGAMIAGIIAWAKHSARKEAQNYQEGPRRTWKC